MDYKGVICEGSEFRMECPRGYYIEVSCLFTCFTMLEMLNCSGSKLEGVPFTPPFFILISRHETMDKENKNFKKKSQIEISK